MTLFVPGAPCKRCGGTERYASCGNCVTCQRSRSDRKTAESRSAAARSELVRKYDLTHAQAEVALVSAQGDFCSSCGTFARLVVDHDHVTGKARGMVCQRCNQIAGALEDQKIQAVKNYLERSVA